MTDARKLAFRQLNLGPELLLHVSDVPVVFPQRSFGIVLVRKDHGKEVTVRVAERASVGQGPPLYVVPFAAESQMHADVEVRMFVKQLYCFGKPRGRNND